LKCMSCGGKSETDKLDVFQYQAAGLSNVFLKGLQIYRCQEHRCQEEEVVIENVVDLHDSLAKLLASQAGRLTPDEIRFLRTHLGFSGADFAREVVCVPPENIAHWERGLAPMNEASERLLRVLILSRQGPFHIEELRGFSSQKTKSKTKRIFKSSKGHWTEV
jgi:putative transcriptional regulator